MKVIFYYQPDGDKFWPPPTDWLGDGIVGDLTVNKIYDVIVDESALQNTPKHRLRYLIKSDVGINTWYNKTLFTPLSEIREERIDSILNEV